MRLIVYILFCFLLLTSCHYSSSQHKAMLNKAENIMQQHPDSALQLLKKISHPKQELSTRDFATYSLLMSQAFDKNDILVQSDSLIKNAVDYFSKKTDYAKAGYSLFYYSRIERNRGNTHGQAEALLKAIPFALKSNDYPLLGFIYNEKATIYGEQNQLDSLILYDKLSFNAFTKTNDKRNQIIVLLAVGYGYYQLSRFSDALFYYKTAEKEAVITGNKSLLSSIDRFLCLSYYYLKNYTTALFYARRALLSTDPFDYSKWINIAAIFIKTNKEDSAKFYLQKCLSTGKTTPDCYQLLQEIATNDKEYPLALLYAQKAFTAKDSIMQKTLTTSFAGMEKKYNYERISRENQKLTIRNQQYFILVIIGLLFCFIISTVILIERNRKKKLALQNEAANNLINQQQLQLQTEQITKIGILQKMIQLSIIPKNNLSQIGAQYLKLFGEELNQLSSTPDEIIKKIDPVLNGFSEKLQLKYPCLTAREIHVCCLLKAGFDHGTILSILDIKSETYYRYRSNIRKKTGANFDDKIEQILSDIK